MKAKDGKHSPFFSMIKKILQKKKNLLHKSLLDHTYVQPSDGFKRLLLEYGSQQSIAVNKYHVYISIITKLCCTSITSCWFAIWKLNKLCSKKRIQFCIYQKEPYKFQFIAGDYTTLAGRNLPMESQSRAHTGGQLMQLPGFSRAEQPLRELISHSSISPETSLKTRWWETLPTYPERTARRAEYRAEWHFSVYVVCQALYCIFRNTLRKWHFLALSQEKTHANSSAHRHASAPPKKRPGGGSRGVTKPRPGWALPGQTGTRCQTRSPRAGQPGVQPPSSCPLSRRQPRCWRGSQPKPPSRSLHRPRYHQDMHQHPPHKFLLLPRCRAAAANCPGAPVEGFSTRPLLPSCQPPGALARAGYKFPTPDGGRRRTRLPSICYAAL